MKDMFAFLWKWEKNFWGNDSEINQYFATISILLIAVIGGVAGAGHTLHSWFDMRTEPDMMILLCMTFFIYGVNMTESIMACHSIKNAILRNYFLFAVFGAAWGVGYLLSIVMIVVALLLMALFVLALLGGGKSSSSSRRSQYLVDKNGNEIPVEDFGYGRKRASDGSVYNENLDGTYSKE